MNPGLEPSVVNILPATLPLLNTSTTLFSAGAPSVISSIDVADLPTSSFLDDEPSGSLF